MLWVIAAGGLAAAAFFGLRPQPVAVESAVAVRGELQTTINAEGRTRVRDRFVVAAPVGGRLSRLRLRRGDRVARGSVVATIEAPPLEPLDPREQGVVEARLTAAQAARREAEAMVARQLTTLAQAERERQRAERLVETGDLSRQEFERWCNVEAAGREELTAARSRQAIAAAEVEAARAALLTNNGRGGAGRPRQSARIEVTSPIDGRVLRLYEESERVVAAGAPLLEISNPETLELVIEVLSTDAVRLRPEMPVIVERWGGDQPLQGKVRVIEPTAFTRISALGIEEQRVNVIADLPERPGTLGDGYRIEARIIVNQLPDVLKLPLGALFREGDDWAVYLIEKGRAHRRLVSLGQRGEREAEVTAGLREGQRVIQRPPRELRDGDRVTELPGGR